MKYFTAKRDLIELPQNETQTLMVGKNFSYIKDHHFIKNSHWETHEYLKIFILFVRNTL